MLQNTKISLVDSTEKLKSLEKILINFRTDDHFHKLCNSASLVAESIQLDPDFLPEPRRRRRNQFDYQRGEETLLSSKDSFRINFFLAILDRTIQAIRERFEQLKNYTDIFFFLHNVPTLNDMPEEQLLQKCKILESKLTNLSDEECPRDIIASDLCREIRLINGFITKEQTPIEVLSFIHRNSLTSEFSNLSIALRILLTIPVAVATGERSFSKLKLIKNYLRTTMSQERLNNLALISIENTVSQTLNLSEIVAEFAAAKARKITFL
ncbi:zinc finger MYM-type protein 1-like [Onthophagus taurus]|uniref:zinc finger MYM-type protein 1-like n=1 Tax=Onthophagus taurus TaxID=166361 RepID=UPI0039BEAEB5